MALGGWGACATSHNPDRAAMSARRVAGRKARFCRRRRTPRGPRSLLGADRARARAVQTPEDPVSCAMQLATFRANTTGSRAGRLWPVLSADSADGCRWPAAVVPLGRDRASDAIRPGHRPFRAAGWRSAQGAALLRACPARLRLPARRASQRPPIRLVAPYGALGAGLSSLRWQRGSSPVRETFESDSE